MTRWAVERFAHPGLTCLGMLLFLGVFLGAWLWVYRRGSGAFYGELGRLPLVGDESHE